MGNYPLVWNTTELRFHPDRRSHAPTPLCVREKRECAAAVVDEASVVYLRQCVDRTANVKAEVSNKIRRMRHVVFAASMITIGLGWKHTVDFKRSVNAATPGEHDYSRFLNLEFLSIKAKVPIETIGIVSPVLVGYLILVLIRMSSNKARFRNEQLALTTFLDRASGPTAPTISRHYRQENGRKQRKLARYLPDLVVGLAGLASMCISVRVSWIDSPRAFWFALALASCVVFSFAAYQWSVQLKRTSLKASLSDHSQIGALMTKTLRLPPGS